MNEPAADGGWPAEDVASLPPVHYAAAGLPATPSFKPKREANLQVGIGDGEGGGGPLLLAAADLEPLSVRTSPYFQDTDLAGFSP
jgi:hypothetical protein